MAERLSITEQFGESLAILLSEKIETAYPKFDTKSFVKAIEKGIGYFGLMVPPFSVQMVPLLEILQY